MFCELICLLIKTIKTGKKTMRIKNWKNIEEIMNKFKIFQKKASKGPNDHDASIYSCCLFDY